MPPLLFPPLRCAALHGLQVCDLSSLSQVAQLADRLNSLEAPVHVLVGE